MLNKITQTVCRCGAEIRSDNRERQHISGNWNERREFQCGLTLTYSPNLNRMDITSPCTNSTEYKRKKAKRKAALEAIVKKIDSLDVDAEWKERARREFRYSDYWS